MRPGVYLVGDHGFNPHPTPLTTFYTSVKVSRLSSAEAEFLRRTDGQAATPRGARRSEDR